MRSSTTLIAVAQLTLLTLALVSCGGQTVPQAQNSQAVSADKVVTLKVKAGTTEADLLSRYPGSKVLSLQADEGYALMKMTPGVLSAKPIGALSLAAQDLTVTGSEDDVTLAASGDDDASGQGYNAWAGGYNAWAGGYNAWAGSASGGAAAGPAGGTVSTAPTLLSENQAAWAMTNIPLGQQLAPALGKGVKVAVLDTGVDIGHPGLAGHLDTQTGWDYVNGDGNVQEQGSGQDFGHGTAVAGIIAQVAPNATIVPWRVLNSDGAGKLSNVIMAVNDATRYGANVINMSLGTTSNSPALLSALTSSIKKGVMIVASSGNSGNTAVTYPARYSPELLTSLGGGLVGVGSVNVKGLKSSFSTYGPGVDVEMPGEAIATLYPGNRRALATGTSFAAPQMSGAIALAMGQGVTDVKTINQGIKYFSVLSTDPTYGQQLGWGIPNIGRAMSGQ